MSTPNGAMEKMYGTYPQAARPAATETELVSAMPSSMYRSGNASRNSASVLDRSAVMRQRSRSSPAAISVTA